MLMMRVIEITVWNSGVGRIPTKSSLIFEINIAVVVIVVAVVIVVCVMTTRATLCPFAENSLQFPLRTVLITIMIIIIIIINGIIIIIIIIINGAVIGVADDKIGMIVT